MLLVISSCKSENDNSLNIKKNINEKYNDWTLLKTLSIEGSVPTGIAVQNESIFLSDSTNQTLIRVSSETGSFDNILKGYQAIDIKKRMGRLMMPMYDRDSIFVYRGSHDIYKFQLPAKLDKPVSFDGFSTENFAIVDQGNSGVLFNVNRKLIRYSLKGADIGNFINPSSVSYLSNLYFIVDAGNKRIQVFNKEAQYVMSFGEDQLVSPTTINNNGEYLFVCDPGKNAILVYNNIGEFVESITTLIDSPVDLCFENELLYVASNKGASISILKNDKYKEL